MDQPEELQQIAKWLSEEGLSPGSPKEAQLCLLWRALQRTSSRLSRVTWDLEKQCSQHSAELAEVRKSLEQIRIFTEHKDVLAQEIENENDQLKDQLQRLISLQDAQISEVAKMLYQQGLTELIHSSASEQVAYLLVERASLLETTEVPDHLKGHGSRGVLEVQAEQKSTYQSLHKGAPRHHQNPWKRLFGLHKASQGRNTFIPAEAKHLASQASSVQKECSRLERDLEEGSRRLAMAHNEIRRLTDELESSHLTQRAYEPELQAAQQEVEQLRQEVEKLKKYELVELRKTKELNDRLDLEIRALRNRVRSLDAEKNIQQQTVVSLQREVERLQSDLKGQQQLLTVHTEDNQDSELTKSQAAELVLVNQTCVNLQKELDARTACLMEKEETVTYLQKNVKKLQSALQEQQWQAEQKLLTAQAQASQVNELVQSQTIELNQSKEICKSLQNNLSAQSRCLLEKESEIHTLKQQLDDSHIKMDNIIATVCQKTKYLEDKSLETPKEADTCDNENNLENSFVTEDSLAQIPQLVHKENKTPMDFPEFREAVTNLMATQEECERLKKEICELLECLDKERSKYHEMKEKHKNKLLRAKQKLDDETTWRDEKIKSQERELSLCSHSLAKEKELTISITMENDKLLLERRRLLQQLNEEEHNKKDCHLTASLSKCRVDFLEIENRKLGNKLLHMSSQLAILERRSQNTQALHLTEELIKTSSPVQDFKCLHVHPQSPNEMKSEPSKSQGLYESAQSKQSDATSPPLQCFLSRSLSRSAEMGYLNLTSAQSRSDLSASLAGFSSSNSTFS